MGIGRSLTARQDGLFRRGECKFGGFDGGGGADTALHEIPLPVEGVCAQPRLVFGSEDFIRGNRALALGIAQVGLCLGEVGARGIER